MTPYEFGKEAANPTGFLNIMRGAGQLAGSAGKSVAGLFGRGGAGRALGIQAQRAGLRAKDLASTAGKTVQNFASRAADLTPRQVGNAVLDRVGGTGQFTMNLMRRGLNAADDTARWAMNGPNRAARTGMRWGDQTIGRTQAAAKGFGSSAMTNARNPLNMAVGAGTIGAGMHYGGLLGGGDSGEQPEQPGAMNDSAMYTGAQQNTGAMLPHGYGQQMGQQMGPQMGMVGGFGGYGGGQQQAGMGGGFGGSGMMDMWNNLPTEAKWAIGAGVPMALAGGLMGGRGGMGLGALGLGAAALGGAAGGMFGDDARRMVGRGMYNIGSFFGGGGNDVGSQLNMLSKFSPQLGATMLMGRDKNLSAEQALQQYNLLTQNRELIQQLAPMLQKQGATALFDKFSRCWKGYEPVPGKAPYSEDSCRPVGSKKKKPAAKKQAASTVFKLTEKKPEAVVNGDKPSSEASKEVAVTRAEPAKKEDLRPEGVLMAGEDKA